MPITLTPPPPPPLRKTEKTCTEYGDCKATAFEAWWKREKRMARIGKKWNFKNPRQTLEEGEREWERQSERSNTNKTINWWEKRRRKRAQNKGVNRKHQRKEQIMGKKCCVKNMW